MYSTVFDKNISRTQSNTSISGLHYIPAQNIARQEYNFQNIARIHQNTSEIYISRRIYILTVFLLYLYIYMQYLFHVLALSPIAFSMHVRLRNSSAAQLRGATTSRKSLLPPYLLSAILLVGCSPLLSLLRLFVLVALALSLLLEQPRRSSRYGLRKGHVG